jgi:uncharacterized protein YbjT (DUF2867 family)
MQKTALILGATGLVGSHLLYRLLESEAYGKVIILVREVLAIKHEKLVQVTVNFEHLLDYADYFKQADTVFCTLGTTIKQAKTKENFERVDFHYPLQAALLTEKAGKRFLLISSMGASVNASVFYNRVKGNLEAQLHNLDLNLFVFRPSLLLGKRKEFRLGERITMIILKFLPFLFVWKWAKYKPIQAQDVANAMYLVSLQDKIGKFLYLSDEIQKIRKQ